MAASRGVWHECSMKRIFAVIELADSSTFDPQSEEHQDEFAEDLLHALPGVLSATVYTSAGDLAADEAGER